MATIYNLDIFPTTDPTAVDNLSFSFSAEVITYSAGIDGYLYSRGICNRVDLILFFIKGNQKRILDT